MPLKESYVIWNNKGGVGKTTLTFHMATQYAESNPDVNVLVIDLCPQANISMALLSTPEQEGCELLASLYKKNSTVSLYLEKQLDLGAKVLYARNYLTCVNEYNKQVKRTSSFFVVICALSWPHEVSTISDAGVILPALSRGRRSRLPSGLLLKARKKESKE